MPELAVAIGVDVGGSKIAFGVVHADGSISNESRVSTTRRGPDWVCEQIVEFAKLHGPSLPVGVAANGAVDRNGVVRYGTYIPWNGYPLRAELETRLATTAYVQNDVTVAAWGEYVRDPAMRSVVVIAAGTGVGGGAVVEGRLLIGRGAAMEIGHLAVSGGTAICVCGKIGCLETIASGSAVEQRYSERVRPVSLALREQMPATQIVQAAVDGDPEAIGVLREAGDALGEVAAALTSVLDPDRFVLSGGLVQGAGELLLGPARESFERRIAPPNHSRAAKLESASFDENGIILGAGSLAAGYAIGSEPRTTTVGTPATYRTRMAQTRIE